MTASRTILIVEDDAGVREVLKEVLEEEGFGTIAAADGTEAVTALESRAEPPCVILLDLMMPRMTGWEFRAWQSRETRFAKIPVIVLSAVRDLMTQVKGLGSVEALPKPIDLEQLLAATERHCRPPAC